MSYKVNQKVIIYNDLFKIKKVENENVYFGCNEKRVFGNYYGTKY